MESDTLLCCECCDDLLDPFGFTLLAPLTAHKGISGGIHSHAQRHNFIYFILVFFQYQTQGQQGWCPSHLPPLLPGPHPPQGMTSTMHWPKLSLGVTSRDSLLFFHRAGAELIRA